jgi:hypothetical protein
VGAYAGAEEAEELQMAISRSAVRMDDHVADLVDLDDRERVGSTLDKRSNDIDLAGGRYSD